MTQVRTTLPTQRGPCEFNQLEVCTTLTHAVSTVGMSMVGTIGGIVSTLSGPAAPIVIPIAGCFVLAKWIYDVYQKS
jgi:hypothetical protein